MTIKMTSSVQMDEVSPEVAIVVGIIASAPIRGTFWITAIQNGKHMKGSKHYPSKDTGFQSDAIDGDCLSTEKNKQVWEYLNEVLNQNFDVLLEDKGKDNEHIHIEHDPN